MSVDVYTFSGYGIKTEVLSEEVISDLCEDNISVEFRISDTENETVFFFRKSMVSLKGNKNVSFSELRKIKEENISPLLIGKITDYLSSKGIKEMEFDYFSCRIVS